MNLTVVGKVHPTSFINPKLPSLYTPLPLKSPLKPLKNLISTLIFLPNPLFTKIGTYRHKLRECEERMKLITGLDPSEITTYPVQITLDQNYKVDPFDSYRELSDNGEMGLVRPMAISERDPYTGKKIKPLNTRKHCLCCCCIPC